MQDAAGVQLDGTLNDRVGNDLHVNTHEENKNGNVIDVRAPFHY